MRHEFTQPRIKVHACNVEQSRNTNNVKSRKCPKTSFFDNFEVQYLQIANTSEK